MIVTASFSSGRKRAKLINLFFSILTLCNCETSLPRDSPSLIFVLYSLFVFIFDFFRFFFFFLVSIFLLCVHNCETSLPRGSPSHYIIVYLCLLFSLCLLLVFFLLFVFFLVAIFSVRNSETSLPWDHYTTVFYHSKKFHQKVKSHWNYLWNDFQ